MFAAVIEKPKKLIIKDVPEQKCGKNEIKIKVEASAICNSTDIHIWQGTFPDNLCPKYPHILGHECSGKIVEIGENADSRQYKKGMRIAFWCKMEGAFGEYNVFNPDDYAVVTIDDRIRPEEGAVMELTAGTMRAVFSSGIKPADKIAVLGLGPAGQLLAQEVKALGAGEVIGIEPIKKRRDLAIDLGIDKALTPEKAQNCQYLETFDIAFDAMGNNKSGVNLGLDILKKNGKYMVFSHATEDLNVSMWKIAHKGIEVIGLGERADIKKTKELLEVSKRWIIEKRINLKKLVSHKIKLEDLERGLTLCKDNPAEVMKVIVNFE